MHSMIKYDLSVFEEDIAFRADFMFFLLKLNAYFESIFWDKFFNNKKKRKNLRKHFIEYEEQLNNGRKKMDMHFKKCIEYDLDLCKRPHLDCYSVHFTGFLKCQPKQFKETQQKVLEQEFGVFSSYEEFLNKIDLLREKRNYLEHYLENKKYYPNKPKTISDDNILYNMALYLLPEMRGMFLGAFKRAEKRILKQKPQLKEKMGQLISHTEMLFLQAHSDRKKDIANIFNLARTREEIKKAQRVSLEIENAKLQNQLWNMCHKHKYRLHNFKWRYHFIGGRVMAEIGKRLETFETIKNSKYTITSNDKLDFKYDYEALYLISMRINLICHHFISTILDNQKVVKMNECETRTQWKKYKKEKQQERANGMDISKIRNVISHNGLFWNALEKDNPKLVFQTIFSAFIEHYGNDKGVVVMNDFYTSVIGVCKKYSSALAFPIKDYENKTATEHVRPWSPKNREKYKNKDAYIIDRRPFLRESVSVLVKSLNEARLEKNDLK